MNREFEYIFDGERYFPVGGMWCPDTLISPDNDPAGIAARLEKDLATLRAIRQGGLDDVYLNLSTRRRSGSASSSSTCSNAKAFTTATS